MATRGPKGKPAHLRLIDGTHRTTRHGAISDIPALPETPATLAKPGYIRAGTRAAKLWAEIAETCYWLSDADGYKLGMWCAMQAEFEKGPAKMTSARISQLRALGSELGLDPSSRSRLGAMKGNRGQAQTEGSGPPPPATVRKKYFED